MAKFRSKKEALDPEYQGRATLRENKRIANMVPLRKNGRQSLVSPKLRPFREPYKNRPSDLPEGWQDAFLDELRVKPLVARAARQAGVSRRTANRYREMDPEFAEAWDDAIEEGRERMLELIDELAEGGNVQAALNLVAIYGFKPSDKNTKPAEQKVTVGWDDK